MSQLLASTPRAFVRCTRPAATLPLLLRLFSTTFPVASEASSSTSASFPAASIPPTMPFPFRIGRTNSFNFPVYHRIKSGGTNRTTEVKKVEGDANALSQQLAEELKLETKVNPRTNHVIIKAGL
ncbi:54S ribosomal protein img2, mitochondrial [Sporothrix eucalyptigena]